MVKDGDRSSRGFVWAHDPVPHGLDLRRPASAVRAATQLLTLDPKRTLAGQRHCAIAFLCGASSNLMDLPTASLQTLSCVRDFVLCAPLRKTLRAVSYGIMLLLMRALTLSLSCVMVETANTRSRNDKLASKAHLHSSHTHLIHLCGIHKRNRAQGTARRCPRARCVCVPCAQPRPGPSLPYSPCERDMMLAL